MGYFSVFLITALVLGVVTQSSGVNLDDVGGYGVTVAIRDGIPQPTEPKDYIQKLRTAFQGFSTQLARSTDGRFFVRSLDILVPDSWEKIEAEEATIQSFDASDIRLTEEDTIPHVDNPNACGLPGYFIDLPHTFFDTGRTGPHGNIGKALLTQWARYRFGVWEEHGHPGEAHYPYFYISDKPEAWKTSSCSDIPLIGSHKNTKTGEECVIKSEKRPDTDCRFIPSATENKAKTSLMGFHTIESITKFCDKDTHDRKAPTRQNALCNYKSIWEVIRESPDYEKIKNSEPSWDIPTIRFRTLRRLASKDENKALRPLFILLDTAVQNAYSKELAEQAWSSLPGLIENILPHKAAVKLAKFPGKQGNNIQYLTEWTSLQTEENRKALIKQIEKLPSEVSKEDGDFSSAILSAVHDIEKLKLQKTGVSLLIIKLGTHGNPSDLASEETVYSAMSALNIKFYAIEATNPKEPATTPVNLIGLAKRRNGIHTLLNDVRKVVHKINLLWYDISDGLPAEDKEPFQVLTQKRAISPKEPFALQLKKDSKVLVRTTISRSIGGKLTVTGIDSPSLYTENEWGLSEQEGAKETLFFTHEYKEDEAPRQVEITFTCKEEDKCNSATLLVSEIYNELPDELAHVDLSITTSAMLQGNQINFETTPIPFAIYAKVTLNGVPVNNAKVTAEVIHGQENSLYVLTDDGRGTPDVQFGDGIYSTSVVPKADGKYQITIQVVKNSDEKGLDEFGGEDVSAFEAYIGCGPKGCGKGVSLTSDLSITEVLPEVLFVNVDSYPNLREAERILDLEVEWSKTRPNTIKFRFTSPSIIGAILEKATKYVIYGAKSIDTFVNEGKPETVASFENVQKTGSEEVFIAELKNKGLIYFGVKAFYKANNLPETESVFSVITRVQSELESNPIPDPEPEPDPSTSPQPTEPETTDGDGDRTTTPKEKSDDTEEKTPFFKTGGGIALIVFLVLLVVLLIAGTAFWFYKKRSGGFRCSV